MSSAELYLPPLPALLVGLEVFTPLGIDTETSSAEIQAGSSGFEQLELDGEGSVPVRRSRSPLISGETRTARLCELARAGLAAHLRAVARLSSRADLLPVVLAWPEPDRGAPFDATAVEAAMRAEGLVAGLRLEFVRTSAAGRAGFGEVLRTGCELLARGAVAVLVGGVDCACDTASLRHLDRARRILGERNPDGLIPGEAAGFGMLVHRNALREPPRPSLALELLCTADEERPFSADQPSLAVGLSAAFRALRERRGAAAGRVGAVLSCQTGETWWGEEFSRAYLRNAPLMPEPLVLQFVARRLGDLGAAAGLVQLAMASAERYSAGAAEAPVLIYGCNDTGGIAACIVSRVASRIAATPEVHAAHQLEPVTQPFALATLERHCEEVGFLLAQRQRYFDNPAISWLAAEDLEERCLRHASAFAVWASDALLSDAQSWLLDATEPDRSRGLAFCLAALAREPTALAAALERAEADVVESLASGIRHARGAAADGVLSRLLASPRPELVALAASLIGQRREQPQGALARCLGRSDLPGQVHVSVAVALAQLGDRSALGPLERALRADPWSAELIEAALLLGSVTALEVARQCLATDTERAPGLIVVAALAAEAGDLQWLQDLPAMASEVKRAKCAALGSLGVPAAGELLIEHLTDADGLVRDSAARALARISGAALLETVRVAQQNSEADEELETRPSQDPALWLRWWREHGLTGRSVRLRRGRPFELRSCLEELLDSGSNQAERALAARELAIRLRRPLAATDSFIDRQRQSIEQARAWC